MTKKRKRARAKKRSRSKSSSSRSISDAGMRVLERAVTGGAQYILESLPHVLQASAELRTEKEFANYYLEPKPLLEAAARRFPRFRRRAKRRTRLGRPLEASLYDDYRIAVLGDLDTPALRKELGNRAQRCFERLMFGSDEPNIESALFLSMLLDPEKGRVLRRGKRVPLGLMGLVTVVYEESFDRAMETVPEARETAGESLYSVWCDRHKEQDLAELDALLEGLPEFDQLGVRLKAESRLAWVWKRQQEGILESLWVHIVSGVLSFEPGFFAPEEIQTAMDRMERRHWSKPWNLSRYLLIPASLNLLACINETLDEIMSRERTAELVKALQAVGQSCFASQDEQMRSFVLAVQAGIEELAVVEPVSRTKVVQNLFLHELIETLSEAKDLSPHWLRFSQQVARSRLIRSMGVQDLGHGS